MNWGRIQLKRSRAHAKWERVYLAFDDKKEVGRSPDDTI
jgi:hypothetical protein